jgi:5-formyltetrahydrofolate cyclo-ligase
MSGGGSEQPVDYWRQKAALRREALARRQALQGREELSQRIWEHLFALPELAAATWIMCYVDFDAEVRTRPFFPRLWAEGKQLVVPYCVGEALELFHLHDLDELTPGAWGILEPQPELRTAPERHVVPARLEMVIVPGVAFDRQGNRVGHGKGFYDRFLRGLPAQTPRVALAFACQLFDAVPRLPHDVPVDKVVTESKVIQPHETIGCINCEKPGDAKSRPASDETNTLKEKKIIRNDKKGTG